MRELLLLLCRYPFDEKNRETLSKLIREVKDWPGLVKLINAHGIIALAAYNIKEAGLEKEIPGDAMAILENGYFKSIQRNAWLTERWKEVNTLLCYAGIKHILLKGMALEHTLYGSRGLRQMTDNDILIKPEESFKAWQLLQQEGFTLDPVKSPLFNKIRFDFGQHLPALYKNGYAIEIHDKLFDNNIIKGRRFEDPFADAVEIFVGDRKTLIPSKEVHLMYLINHFEHHTMSGECQLRLYTDIILLDKSNSIEVPDRFISDPMQGNKKEFRKAAYKARIRAIPPKHRLRFLIGDTFPSVKWMKERYKCSGLNVMLRYPIRIGKLWWLI
jgi:Uncharacterised nucleotidyltransferase